MEEQVRRVARAINEGEYSYLDFTLALEKLLQGKVAMVLNTSQKNPFMVSTTFVQWARGKGYYPKCNPNHFDPEEMELALRVEANHISNTVIGKDVYKRVILAHHMLEFGRYLDQNPEKKPAVDQEVMEKFFKSKLLFLKHESNFPEEKANHIVQGLFFASEVPGDFRYVFNEQHVALKIGTMNNMEFICVIE